MHVLLVLIVVSYVMASVIFSLVVRSVVMLLADTHRVYIMQKSSNSPYILLLLLVPIFNVLLGLIAAYTITTDMFMFRMGMLSESMTLDEATMFDANPTFNTAIAITKVHNQA